MNSKPVSNKTGAGIKFRAWGVSIALHLIVLTAFAVLRFSQSQTQSSQHTIPTASVNRVTELSNSFSVMPKPTIKKPVQKNKKVAIVQSKNFQTAKLSSQNSPIFKEEPIPENFLPAEQPIEFFGNKTYQRKICFVVDRSGSMRGIFRSVQKNLARSIAKLQQDQYFYIIFFGDDKIVESGNGKLIRASEHAKRSAHKLINSVEPKGKTNALAAIEKALRIRDNNANAPAVIYFLTDGFELAGLEGRQFTSEVAELLKKFAPTSKINTIGFWPQRSDRDILSTIALQSNGRAVFITEENFNLGND